MVLASDQPQFAAQTVVTTLLVTDLVDSTSLVDRLGDAKAASIFSQQDRLARDLLKTHGGQEIDKTDGFLMLFARPVDAVLYALAYHVGLAELSEELGVELRVRAGIHLGEVIVHRNAPEDVARGAKPVEVEGLAKPMAARIMSLALGGQTLITRSAFDLARRGVVGSETAPQRTKWMAHGPYVLKGCDEPVEIFEVGVDGSAPLCAPPDSAKARRSVAAGDEETLGWRPARSSAQRLDDRPKARRRRLR
ncbi:MAG: adenylate/guanylate cyclase domain-containing protein [Phycisphaerales bacterium]